VKFGVMYNTGIYDMAPADIESHAARGTTRLVFGPASTDLNEQREQLAAFAERAGLTSSRP